ncbi:MAG: hypothetical protein JW965_09830 [Bacteroidales bacterium]|nr:hypothetical protein [Bacteroidales bacterium]
MTQFSKKISFTVLFACTLIVTASSQENLLDYDNSLKFARYLKSTRQYNFAMEEYERLHFLWPGDTTISLELVQTYRLNEQCNRLEASFEILLKNIYHFNSLPAVKEYLAFSLTCKSGSERFFDISSMLQPPERSFFELSYYWSVQKYDSAFAYCGNNRDLLEKHSPDLYNLTFDFENEKYKSPALAVVMSAVIPGSGKAYSKRWGDAIVSFLFVGTNAFTSYRAFNKKGIKSVNGWIFGSLAFSFYSANLWGSAKAAKTYNSNIQKRYQDNAENIIYNSF